MNVPTNSTKVKISDVGLTAQRNDVIGETFAKDFGTPSPQLRAAGRRSRIALHSSRGRPLRTLFANCQVCLATPTAEPPDEAKRPKPCLGIGSYVWVVVIHSY
jgi:hypothetical protein